MSKELGARILEMLKERKMTQRELARNINITEAQLSRYISGDRDPKPDVLANIATALQTTSDYLLGLSVGDFNVNQIRTLIARNAEYMSDEEKRALMNALFGKE